MSTQFSQFIIKVILFTMEKQKSGLCNQLIFNLPLYKDTQFIPSSFPYVIFHNSKISSNPIVVPYEDQATTFQQLQQNTSKMSGVVVQKSIIKKKSGLEIISKNSIEKYKLMEKKKYINGEEFYINDPPMESCNNFNKNNVNQNVVYDENYEKYEICCIMLQNPENVFHLQFKMSQNLSIQSLILEQVNKSLQKKLSLENIRVQSLETTFHTSQKKEVAFFFQAKKLLKLKQQLISSKNLIYIGVDYPNSKKASQIIPVIKNFIGIFINNSLSLLAFESLAKYPIKFILAILKVQNPESKGLKILNKIYSPHQTLADLTETYKSFTKINYLEAIIVEQDELLIKDLKAKNELMSKKQLQNLVQSDPSYRQVILRQKKQEISSVNVYNSTFKIYNNKCKQNIYFYRLINQFLNNYYTHNVEFYDSSVRSRFILSMYEEMANLKSYNGYCYRKVSYLMNYKQNDVLTFKNFIVASKNQILACSMKLGNGKSQTIFKIKSTKGKQIQNQSNLQQVIFLPHTKFLIKKKQQINGNTLYQLQQINQTITPNNCNILIWLDQQNKKLQNLTFYNNVYKDASKSIIFKQLHSNQSFEQWITQNYSLLKQNHKTVVITNMVRHEKGIEDKNAGVQTIKLARKRINNVCTIAYVGYIEFAYQKLKENNIDSKNVHVVNLILPLTQIINQFFGLPKQIDNKQIYVEKKPINKVEENVKKQDWQDFFSSITVTNGGKQAWVSSFKMNHGEKTPFNSQQSLIKIGDSLYSNCQMGPKIMAGQLLQSKPKGQVGQNSGFFQGQKNNEISKLGKKKI